MKKILIVFPVLLVVLLGCHHATDELTNETKNEDAIVNEVSSPSSYMEIASYDYLNFEEAVLEFATHIVVAQYVDSRPFGETHTEFEFMVLDTILGDTTERIFVFVERIDATVHGHTHEVQFMPGDLSFERDVNYLLPLIRMGDVTSIVERDGDRFAFVRQIVIDLDEPANSMIYSEDLADHIEGIDLDEEITTEEIITFVEDLAEKIEEIGRFERIIIDSNDMQEIIEGSPYIWVVEIQEAWRLAHEAEVTIWRSNDIYFVTIIDALYGGMDVSLEGGTIDAPRVFMTFMPDEVFPGEQHIVAVQPLAEDDLGWFVPTSRYNVFSMDQLDEIISILEEQ